MNSLRKIPESQFTSILNFLGIFHRLSAGNLKVELRTDGQTDTLIWGWLGNLRFLQVKQTRYLWLWYYHRQGPRYYVCEISVIGLLYFLIIMLGLPLLVDFCKLKNPKTVISNFVTTRQFETPYYSSPCKYYYPNDVPVGQKNSRRKRNSSTTMN